MAYQVGDIVEVTWEQSIFSQVILNIQHYRVVSASGSGSDVGDNQSFADHLAALTGAAQLITEWSSTLDPNWTLHRVRTQKIDPTRSAYTTSPINVGGQAAGADVLTNIAAVVSKRGTSGTRRAQGSIHFAGWQPAFTNSGEWQAGVDTWWNTLEPLWSATQNVAAIPASLQPVLYNPGAAPNWQQIAVWQLQPTVRVMRRRTVRVGI